MVDRFFGPDEPWPNELGDMVRYSDYAALKAENERLTVERDDALVVKREAIAGWKEAESALAERAGGVSHDMRWPKAGDKMRFLNENGYDAERERAARVFAINQDYTVKDISIGSWSSSIYFEEVSGGWNSVMFGFPEATLTTEPAAPEGRQEAVALPPYGNMPFDELGRDVSEAVIGIRHDFDFGETYPGHVMTGINFNSLNRIVSKHVTRPAEQAVTGRWKRDFSVWLESTHGHVSMYQAYHAGRSAALAQKEEGR